MEFRTRLVIGKKNKRALLAWVGLLIAVASLGMIFFPPLAAYVPWAFSAGIVVLIVGAVRAKGDIASYGLSDKELVLTAGSIVINGEEYPMKKVRKLDFNIEGYAGMPDRSSGYSLHGMGNELRFDWEGRVVTCGFYLNSEKHTLQLRDQFREYYEAHIPFVERSGNTRTFLFKNLSGKELEEFKKKYGYA
jgi:hypothetical protein